MTYVSLPRPSYLDQLEKLSWNGSSRWRDIKGNIYTFDALHGEIEVFNKRGKHLGAMHVMTGIMIKEAVKGRTIDV